jgi:hypothetical protein
MKDWLFTQRTPSLRKVAEKCSANYDTTDLCTLCLLLASSDHNLSVDDIRSLASTNRSSHHQFHCQFSCGNGIAEQPCRNEDEIIAVQNAGEGWWRGLRSRAGGWRG